jgi:hypothetical protein
MGLARTDLGGAELQIEKLNGELKAVHAIMTTLEILLTGIKRALRPKLWML